MRALDFFALIPKPFLSRSFVAGGAAVDFSKALDVDLWILRPAVLAPAALLDLRYYANLQEELNAYYENEGFLDLMKRNIDEQVQPYSAAIVLFDGHYQGHKVQILASRFDTWQGMLREFDLSVHQKAISSEGASLTLETTTKPGEDIRITNFHTPDYTFKRLRKLLQRYGGLHNTLDLEQLVLMQDNIAQEIFI